MSEDLLGPEDWCDTKEAADILGKKPATLEADRSQGRGPPFMKNGKIVRYSRKGLVKYMISTMQNPTPAKQRRALKGV